jgi:hypothetical protein
MPWKFYLGACFLTSALLMPHAGLQPTAAGALLAGAVVWAWARFTRGRND